jgi:hypothetical protein
MLFIHYLVQHTGDYNNINIIKKIPYKHVWYNEINLLSCLQTTYVVGKFIVVDINSLDFDAVIHKLAKFSNIVSNVPSALTARTKFINKK